jgi:subtilisin family serine protease
VVTYTSQQDINSIKSSIPEADVQLLSGGHAVVYSSKLDQNTLNSKLSKVKGLKASRKPQRMRVAPTQSQEVTIQNKSNLFSRLLGKSKSISIRDLEWDYQDVEANKAWSQIKQVRQIKVAVVDTGIDYNHPALKGRIDLADGYNFVSNTSDPLDDNGHGTHVSGIIATNSPLNGTGLLGIDGNLDVQIMPVKVLDSTGSGDSDIIARGIQWAADRGADIINLSLGGRGASPEIDSAINYATSKGVFVVAAAGNDNSDSKYYTPASNPNVFTVAALGMNDRKASYSNYGSNVEGAAPGDYIVSTIPNGKYALMSGTSMATPVVSGIAAMIKAQNPNLTPSQIKQILNKSAVDIGTKGKDIYYGYGKVDAYKAINLTNGVK